jgi:hypothetical protein
MRVLRMGDVGGKPTKHQHCCEEMTYYVNMECDQHDNPFDCPDNTIFYNEVLDEYGVIVHDGGEAYILIEYCPWCGKKLPDSKRMLWFDRLEELGIDSAFDDKIPQELRISKWWEQ